MCIGWIQGPRGGEEGGLDRSRGAEQCAARQDN